MILVWSWWPCWGLRPAQPAWHEPCHTGSGQQHVVWELHNISTAYPVTYPNFTISSEVTYPSTQPKTCSYILSNIKRRQPSRPNYPKHSSRQKMRLTCTKTWLPKSHLTELSTTTSPKKEFCKLNVDLNIKSFLLQILNSDWEAAVWFNWFMSKHQTGNRFIPHASYSKTNRQQHAQVLLGWSSDSGGSTVYPKWSKLLLVTELSLALCSSQKQVTADAGDKIFSSLTSAWNNSAQLTVFEPFRA